MTKKCNFSAEIETENYEMFKNYALKQGKSVSEWLEEIVCDIIEYKTYSIEVNQNMFPDPIIYQEASKLALTEDGRIYPDDKSCSLKFENKSISNIKNIDLLCEEVEFINCEFTDDILLDNIQMSSVSFENCTINGNIELENCRFRYCELPPIKMDGFLKKKQMGLSLLISNEIPSIFLLRIQSERITVTIHAVVSQSHPGVPTGDGRVPGNSWYVYVVL